MTQVARNLTGARDGFLRGVQFLILDRDPLYTAAFRSLLRGSGVKPLVLPAWKEIVEQTLKHEAGTVRDSTRPCRHRSWSGSEPPAPLGGFSNCSTNSGSRTAWDIRRR